VTQWTQRDFGDQGEYPLALGSVYGVRWWSLDRTGLLRGVKAVWLPEENVADCINGSMMSPTARSFRDWARGAGPSELPRELHQDGLPPVHETPVEQCTCGFYAFWEAEPPPVGGHFPVAGVVEGYGRTVIGNRGFRCQRARIVALHVPLAADADCETVSLVSDVESRLSDRYMVPVYATMRLMLLRHPPTTEYSG
jgi:hypothetical protein